MFIYLFLDFCYFIDLYYVIIIVNSFGASLTSNNASTSTGDSGRSAAPAARRTTSLTSPATRIIGFSEGPRARDREPGKSLSRSDCCNIRRLYLCFWLV